MPTLSVRDRPSRQVLLCTLYLQRVLDTQSSQDGGSVHHATHDILGQRAAAAIKGSGSRYSNPDFRDFTEINVKLAVVRRWVWHDERGQTMHRRCCLSLMRRLNRLRKHSDPQASSPPMHLRDRHCGLGYQLLKGHTPRRQHIGFDEGALSRTSID